MHFPWGESERGCARIFHGVAPGFNPERVSNRFAVCQNLMFVGTGAGGGVFVVCPSDGEMVRGAEDVPAGVPVAVGVWLGNFPQSDAVGAGVGAA